MAHNRCLFIVRTLETMRLLAIALKINLLIKALRGSALAC